VSLGAGLDRCGKSRPPSRFDLRTFQPVASRYTDYAIPSPNLNLKKKLIGKLFYRALLFYFIERALKIASVFLCFIKLLES
jgi:hypothetical protein